MYFNFLPRISENYITIFDSTKEHENVDNNETESPFCFELHFCSQIICIVCHFMMQLQEVFFSVYRDVNFRSLFSSFLVRGTKMTFKSSNFTLQLSSVFSTKKPF